MGVTPVFLLDAAAQWTSPRRRCGGPPDGSAIFPHCRTQGFQAFTAFLRLLTNEPAAQSSKLRRVLGIDVAGAIEEREAPDAAVAGSEFAVAADIAKGPFVAGAGAEVIFPMTITLWLPWLPPPTLTRRCRPSWSG